MTTVKRAQSKYDAVIVGSGPNGLSAAITLAKQGLRVLVIEGKDTIGGGVRSKEFTLPGFTHDVCSAVHPLALSSPFFRSIDLKRYGLKWIQSPYVLAHPLENEKAILLNQNLEEFVAGLGADARNYQRIFFPLVRNSDHLIDDLLGPLRIPRFPLTFARFGLNAMRSAAEFARSNFQNSGTRALFAGMAAHGMIPLHRMASASFGIVLTLSAHTVGWPIPQGGAQQIVNSLTAILHNLGGEVLTGEMVTDLHQLPRTPVTLLDVSPKTLIQIAGDALPESYLRPLKRYRFGAGVFKIDWALDAPIPWTNPLVSQAATVHLGGTFEEILASEQEVAQGGLPAKPFVILVQPSLFDPSRAPAGKHTAWAYCHVPNGSQVDMRERIEKQVERFAPGFRSHILAAHTITAAEYETYNPNYVGGDINTGAQDLGQMFTRPAIRWDSYSTPLKGVYLCSSATPPGGGVHGMCGYLAAKSALKREYNIQI